MSLSATFQTDVIEFVNGHGIHLPLVTMTDLSELAGQMQAERRAAARLAVKESGLSQVQAFRAIQEVDLGDIGITDLVRRLFTPGGVAWAMKKSLAKAGKSEQEQSAILAQIGNARACELAFQVTGLDKWLNPAPSPLEAAHAASKSDEVDRPLAPAAAGTQAP